MNARFSRQLAALIQQPPADMHPLKVIKIREDLDRAAGREANQFSDLPEDLQEQLRQWPRYQHIFGQASPEGSGATGFNQDNFPPMKLEPVKGQPPAIAVEILGEDFFNESSSDRPRQ